MVFEEYENIRDVKLTIFGLDKDDILVQPAQQKADEKI